MRIVWQSGRNAIDLGTHVKQHCERCGVERPFNIFLEYGYWGVFYIFNSVTDKQCKLLCYYCKQGWNLDRSNSEMEVMSKAIPFMDRRGIPAFIGMSILILALYLSLGAGTPGGAIEALDAEKVYKAQEHLVSGDVQSARRLLEEVVANAPEEYVYQHHDGDTRYIKFWDKEELDHYVSWQRDHGDARRVSWTPSAYPPAYYYLGFISVKEQQYAEAIELLDAGHRLEPTNPKFLLEKAVVYTLLEDYQRALSHYDQVQDVGPHVSPADKAQALRGKAIILVEMGELDAAEAALKESLAYDPDSKVAANELAVIEKLRSGRQVGPMELVERPEKQSKRAIAQ